MSENIINKAEKKLRKIYVPIGYFILLVIIVIILTLDRYNQKQTIEELNNRLENLEQYTNIYAFINKDFEASRLPLWRQCVNGKQIGEPLAYALVLVNKDYMIKVPEDKLALKNGTLYECEGSLVR